MTDDNVTHMRFLVIGAGAIGSYIGGSLILSGQKVLFLEKAQNAAIIRNQGLRLSFDGQAHHIHMPEVAMTIEDALEHGPFDIAILAVKAYDLADLLDTLSAYRVALPPILCLQNGVDSEDQIAAVLGAEKVITGTLTSAISKRGTGSVSVERRRGMGVASTHTLSAALVAVFNSAGLHARLYPDAAAMKWSKMVTNLLANASAAILDMSPGEILSDARLYRIEIEQMREAFRVMAALRIGVANLPGIPVRFLATLVNRLPPDVSRIVLARVAGSGRGEKMPSFHIDLHSGRHRSEVDYLNGAVVRHGKAAGVPTPVNRILTDTLTALVTGRLAVESYAHQIDRYLDLFRLQQEGLR